MKLQERIRGLYRAPQLFRDIVLNGRYDFIYDQMPIRIRDMSLLQRWNLARSGLNLVYRRLKPWSYPLHMQFEPVNYCQLKCPVCPAGTGELQRKPRVMDPGVFTNVLREVGPYLITMSLWGWGESLLHPALGEFLREARSYKAAVLLSTNGQNLDRPEVVAAILEHPPTFLIVALDGLTDATNSRFRIGALLEPALRGVKLLVEERKRLGKQHPILQMRFIVMKHNRHEMLEAESFARAHGFDMLSFRRLAIIDSDSGLKNQSELTANTGAYHSRPHDSGSSRLSNKFICMQPFWYPTLFADGTLVACEQDFNAQLPLGNMDGKTRFAELWFGGVSIQARRQIRDAYQSLSFCRNCPVFERDRTDCSVDSIWLRPGIQQPVVT